MDECSWYTLYIQLIYTGSGHPSSWRRYVRRSCQSCCCGSCRHVTSVFRSTRLLDVHVYVQLTTAIWLSHVYRHSAMVLVVFVFQGPPSGTHSHKTYETVTFPGNSSSVDLRHGCLSVLMCRRRVWEFFIEDALYKFPFLIWFDLILYISPPQTHLYSACILVALLLDSWSCEQH